MKTKSPVLFLIFNRPETTREVFQSIREARPTKLYIAADGPREDHEGENVLCEEARNISTNVDWNCEVKTLFRDDNLGCKYAVSGAIDWFFDHEEMGIILEDDCLPNKFFFKYCEDLLKKYKLDSRIMHINGNNFGAERSNFFKSEYSYHFGRMPQVWGWATWRRAWDFFDVEMNNYLLFNYTNYAKEIFTKNNHTIKQINRWERAINEKVDTWDFQWQFAVISNHGLTTVPKKNLISNIGFGDDATHTHKVNDGKAMLKTNEIKFPLTHPNCVVPDKKIDRWYQDNMLGSDSFLLRIKNKIISLVK